MFRDWTLESTGMTQLNTPSAKSWSHGFQFGEQDPRMIRLSFRKGGDKPFYAVLRRSLLGKGWEVRLLSLFQAIPKCLTPHS